MKILWMTNLASPYRIDFFNNLGNNSNLTVIFERENAKDREKAWIKEGYDNFKAVLLNGVPIGNDSVLSFEIIKYINEEKYDVIIISNYGSPSSIIAITYMKLKKIPFILCVDGGLIKKDNPIKKIIKKILIGSANWWLSTSQYTDKYLIHYGAKKEYIYRYPFTSIHLSEIKPGITQEQKLIIRKKLGFSDKKLAIAVGRFIKLKRFDFLIKVWAKIDSDCRLLIIGGGEERPLYEEIINHYEIKNVTLIDFKPKNELCEYYEAADLLIFPTSGDVWGLVINEAIAVGLPVISTDKSIAGLELIENGENGYIIPVDNEIDLVESINKIFGSEELRRKMSRNNIQKCYTYTIENMVTTHIEIFDKIISNKSMR